MNKLRTDFDLPTNHLKNAKYYVPPKARTSTEIDRRRELPGGSLILEQQQLGAKIGQLLLSRVENHEDLKFVSTVLTAAGLNTAWYSFGQTDSVMRRRLKLPILAVDYDVYPNSQPDLLATGEQHLSKVSELANDLTNAYIASSPRRNKLKTIFGRSVGDAALSVNCINMTDQIRGASSYMIQNMVRSSCLVALQRSKVLCELSYPPSLAQLPDTDSDLAVLIRRSAPNRVYETYDEAISQFAISR